jgi:hypothetical protein
VLLLEVIVIQEALLNAVQVHPDEAVTLTVPGPPEEAADWEVGGILYVQAPEVV